VTEERPYPTGQSVLLEAMASGRACVVTRTDALAEYVRDGVDVVCVAPGSSAEVHSAVERLRADPVTRSRLGAEAADRVARAFDTRNMWAAIAPLLRSGGKQ
jgi:glycosyltransferase involved in cell wall biosynthesis